MNLVHVPVMNALAGPKMDVFVKHALRPPGIAKGEHLPTLPAPWQH
jgi:hypothetical protein